MSGPGSHRIVVVEDDVSIGDGLAAALTSHGYRVEWCTTGSEATAAIDREAVDLVLLDAGLPDVDGFTLCRWLREQHRDLPIIMVTARDSEIDVIVGLDAGASDYVTKPFSTSVLLARVRAHLRDSGAVDAEASIEIGALHVDPSAYVATVNGRVVDLRRREFELLVYLARQVGKAVTRERLLSDVWDMNWESSTKTVDMHIVALRRKLGESVDIVTVRGIGYRLDAP